MYLVLVQYNTSTHLLLLALYYRLVVFHMSSTVLVLGTSRVDISKIFYLFLLLRCFSFLLRFCYFVARKAKNIDDVSEYMKLNIVSVVFYDDSNLMLYNV